MSLAVSSPAAWLAALVAVAACGAGAWAFRRRRRRRGLLPGPRRQRVLREDALKHLHDTEYRGVTGSLESLAGALEQPSARAARLVETMEADGLVERRGTALRLTESGRLDARRILRVHRLWERWLAEETGVDETEWHARAEKREHTMSLEEAEELAARMGQPAWDPHGDPIPTAEGKLPPPRGVPLPSLDVDDAGTVVHLEDEPEALYAELVGQGLHPGMVVRVVESSSDRVRLFGEGRELTLSPVAAANVSVAFDGEALPPDGFETLEDLRPGESADVRSLLPGCIGAQRRRLLDLGLVPGTRVVAEMASAAGDPIAYRIRGSLVALRREQTRWVHVERPASVPETEAAS